MKVISMRKRKNLLYFSLFVYLLFIGILISNLSPIFIGRIETSLGFENVLDDSISKMRVSTSFNNNFATLRGYGGPVWALAFSPDDSTLASGCRDGSVRLWNASDGTTLKLLQGHAYNSYSVDFSLDGSILASAGWTDENINLWNVTTGNLTQTWIDAFRGSRIEFSPTVNSLLAYPQDTVIKLRNITDGVVLQNMTGHTNMINSIAFSPNGSLLASCSRDNSVKLWDVTSGTELRSLLGHVGEVFSVAFSPDNKILASGGVDFTIRIWNVTSGALIQTLNAGDSERIFGLAFSPTDSTILASGGGLGVEGTGAIPMYHSSIEIWNLTSGEVVETLMGHSNEVTQLHFSHDGSILASASRDRSIKLWGSYPNLEVESPSDPWPISTPEEHGMNSTLLDIGVLKNNLHSFLVFRHNTLIYEEYYNATAFQYNQESKHPIFSVTKSFISALIGIAIEEGFIQSTDQFVMDFFPEYTFNNLDQRKEAITLYHLLTMTTGLPWDDDIDFVPLLQSSDPVQYVLDKAMVYEPGQVFNYNTGASHMLSRIIQKTTGRPTLEYAIENLFTPLGIERNDIVWQTDPQGCAYGGHGLYLTPRNMAKLGHLYLNNGTWDGQQIVPKDWVEASTTNHIAGLRVDSSEHPAAYGYQWWIYPGDLKEGYTGVGYNGQFVYVIPKQDIVFVTTSGSWRQPSTIASYVAQAIITQPKATTIPSTTQATPGYDFMLVFAVFTIIICIEKRLKRR
jgi:WD40 repeat protein